MTTSKEIKQILIAILFAGSGCGSDHGTAVQTPDPAPTLPVVETGTQGTGTSAYVGSTTCQRCHEEVFSKYSGSHHDLAMQYASESSVLGDFNDSFYTYNGFTSRFFRDSGRYMVETDNRDGDAEIFQVRFTFGVYPLQQYLVEFPDGRLQALGIAWDSRASAAGGQHWYHLYPDQDVDHADALHWTGVNQNWNHMCADCHVTGFAKHYDAENNRFNSNWTEVNVSCEACHGPGSGHVGFIAGLAPGEAVSGNAGFPLSLSRPADRVWTFRNGEKIASLPAPASMQSQIESCARCHSRRTTIKSGEVALHDLLDTHDVALLEQGLYHADGQVDDEVYVYGSFIQSRMYAAGVTCTDCHDPHSAMPVADGNTLCMGCHLKSAYDTVSHHFHTAPEAATRCITCHMPAKNFMGIDTRHDHSFRVPRPDLTITTGVPNVCNHCHSGESARWAADVIRSRSGQSPPAAPLAAALQAARSHAAGAGALLRQVAADNGQPVIARATALELMREYMDTRNLQVVADQTGSEHAMIRAAALKSLAALDPRDRLQLARTSLRDPVRLVRITAARLLAAFYPENLPRNDKRDLDAALDEYVAAQNENADRAYAQVNLGDLYLDMRRYDQAEAAYRRAIVLDRLFLPAYTNLADLYRVLSRDREAASVLSAGLVHSPDSAALHHALGLAQVRLQQTEQALAELRSAAELEPGTLRYSLVYGIALNSTGNPAAAVSILTAALERLGTNRDLLITLATIHRDLGESGTAIRYAEMLLESDREDRQARQLLDSLREDGAGG